MPDLHPLGNVSSATTIFLTPHRSGSIMLYDGATWHLRLSGEVSLALSGLTINKNYDVFAYWTGSTVALELSAAWATDTARTDALVRQDGVLVKSGAPTRRYVGTFRAAGTNFTHDTVLQRFLWNMYNRVSRPLAVFEATDSWTYSGTVYRAANGNTANAFELVTGQIERVTAGVRTIVSAGTTGWGASVGIGIDSTTANSATWYGSISSASAYIPCLADYPSVGYHKFTWLEISGGIVLTLYGDVGNSTFFKFGMIGSVEG